LARRKQGTCSPPPSSAIHCLNGNLLTECRKILKHLAEVAAHTRFTEEYIDSRTNNILESIRMAESIERGMVVIWQRASKEIRYSGHHVRLWT
jgi:hypothetical protein